MTVELVWSPHQSTLPPSGSTSSFEASNLHKARYRIGLSHGGINQVGHAIAMQWVNEVAPAITSTGRDFQLVPHKEGSNYQCSRFHTPMLPEEWDKLMHKNEQSTNAWLKLTIVYTCCGQKIQRVALIKVFVITASLPQQQLVKSYHVNKWTTNESPFSVAAVSMIAHK